MSDTSITIVGSLWAIAALLVGIAIAKIIKRREDAPRF